MIQNTGTIYEKISLIKFKKVKTSYVARPPPAKSKVNDKLGEIFAIYADLPNI